jgi:hypothetical protein
MTEGKMAKDSGKWMQAESEREEKAGTKGSLRRYTKTKPGHNIPVKLLHKLAKQEGLVGKRARMALRYREANKGK